MKKFSNLRPIAIVAATAFVFVACNTKTEETKGMSMSSRAQKNIATVDSVSHAITSGDFSRIDSFLAPDVVDHASETGTKRGRDSVKAHLQQMAAGMPGMKSEIVNAFA